MTYPRTWRDIDEVPEEELRDWIDSQREPCHLCDDGGITGDGKLCPLCDAVPGQ